MQYRLAVTASGSRHVLVCIVVSLGSITAVAAPTAAAQRAAGAVVCTAQRTAAGLDVHCPSATVAELLSVLQQATGLRSEYPQELAPARVSVTLRRRSLLEVLESALSAFNFAVWMDQSSPSVTWVTLLDLRGAVERPDQPRAYQQTSKRSPEAGPGSIASEVAPGSTASLPPLNNQKEMTEVRESFARSITSTYEVEPIPVVTSPVIMPGVDAPR